jgi:hypothetical protein
MWKVTDHEARSVTDNEIEMYKTAMLLPPYLINEVIDLEQKYDITKESQEDNQFNEMMEYNPNFLYTPQVLRVYPDDYHQVLRTMINSSALIKSSTAGKDDESGVSANVEEEDNS